MGPRVATAPSIWIYTVDLHPRFEEAASAGGPQGEILSRRSLSAGLRELGHSIVEIRTLREFAWRRLWVRFGRAPRVLVLDRWTIDMARRYRLLSDNDARGVFLLDWFGIGSRTVASGIPAERHLTPYPEAGHGFLGFFLSDDRGPVADTAELKKRLVDNWTDKAPQVLIWGKEPRYFDERARKVIVALVADGIRVVATVDRGRGFDAELHRLGVVNKGHLDGPAFRILLRESRVLLGLGDPVLGPTPVEALLAGCSYVDPTFPDERVIENGRTQVASQHPFCARQPEPFVFQTPLDSLLEGARRALNRKPPSDTDLARLGEALGPFTQAAYLARLEGLLPAGGPTSGKPPS
jgi:hypothetical protein